MNSLPLGGDDSALAASCADGDEVGTRAAGEIAARARQTGLLGTLLAFVTTPAWTGFDRALEPELASSFLTVRLAGEIPLLVILYVLWRTPQGRSHPGAWTAAAFSVVQLEILWMLPQVDHLEMYLLGLSLLLYGCAAGLATHPGWTAALAAISTVGALLAITVGSPGTETHALLSVGWFMGTASCASVTAHVVRYISLRHEVWSRVALGVEQRRTQALVLELQRVTTEDALTGAANRRRWDVALLSAWQRVGAVGGNFSVILVDVDKFKHVNDTLGHAAGDRVLRTAVTAMRSVARETDLVARLGGDEFAILLDAADGPTAVAVAERVRLSVAKATEVDLGSAVTVSLGVVWSGNDFCSVDDLLSAADRQLYRAKEGRDRVCSSHNLNGSEMADKA